MRITKDAVKKEIWEWVKAIIIAIILTTILKTFVIQAFKIPSGSMIPTLLPGDRIFVNKFVLDFRDPKRWEVIVFKYPDDKKKDFIKRVIAVGGEEVEIRSGQIFIDSKLVKTPEVLDGIYYYNQEPYGGTNQPFTIPENSFYVLGDNSMSSRDSRYWGFVPKKDLVGSAIFRWWPPRRFGKLNQSIAEEE
jgi:signal peptidase I